MSDTFKDLKKEIHEIICELGADPNICAVIGSWLDDIYSDEETLRDLKSFRDDNFNVIVKNDDYDKIKSEQDKKKLIEARIITVIGDDLTYGVYPLPEEIETSDLNQINNHLRSLGIKRYTISYVPRTVKLIYDKELKNPKKTGDDYPFPKPD